MSIIKKYSLISRSLISILLLIILYVSTVNFIGTAASPNDENLFSDPVSRLYLVKPLILYDTLKLKKEQVEQLEPGLLILEIGDTKTTDTTKLKHLFDKYKNKEFISLMLFDTYANKKLTKFVSIDELRNGAISYLTSAVLVSDVFEGGASDRAGMLTGDLIIRINGKQFKNMFEADSLLQKTKTGHATQYDVLRNNKVITLRLVPVKYGLPFVYIFQHLSALLAIFFGTFIALKRPKIRAALYLGLGLLLFGSVFSLSTIRLGLLFESSIFNISKIILILISIQFSIALLLSSTLYFPYKTGLSEKKWLKYFLLSYAGFFLSLSILNAFWLKVPFLDRVFNYSIIAILIAFAVIRIIFRKSYSFEYKRTNRWIFISFSLFLLIRLSLPYFYLFTSIDIMFIANYLSISLFISILIAYYYTIAKYRLLDIKIRIKRNIQYTLITVSWRILAVLILAILLVFISKLNISFPNINIEGTNIEVLSTPLSIELQEFYGKVFLVIISIIITIFWWKFKKYIQHNLDRRYHRTSFDYRRATSELSKFLVRNFTLYDLTQNIAKELADLTHLKKIGIVIFKNEETVVAHDYFGVKNIELVELIQSSGSRIANATKEYKDDFRVEYLPEPFNIILRDFGFRFIQPIYSKSRLLGMLLIGEKMSESPFNKDDFEFLHTISGQISVAIENSFLYEDLTQQERIKHELNIARRIQMASLPDTIPNIQGLEISGVSLPALEVGGDFYDFLETENGEFMVIIGDVSGKGTSAALYMSKIQGIMRTLHQFRLSPRKLLIQTNHLLYQYLEKGYFISATSINFDLNKRKVCIARAGHLPLFLYKNETKTLQKVINRGMVLGLTRDKTFERNLDETDIEFANGDIFVLITDGISEAKNNLLQEYSDDRLVELIKQNSNLSAEELRDTIVKSVKEFSDTESQYDDMTVVVVKIK